MRARATVDEQQPNKLIEKDRRKKYGKKKSKQTQLMKWTRCGVNNKYSFDVFELQLGVCEATITEQ